MTHDMFKTLTAALVAGSVGQGALSAPALAGGRVFATYAPANARDAGALATGLRVYSLYHGLRGASIRQLDTAILRASPRTAAAMWASSDRGATAIQLPCSRTAMITSTAFSSSAEGPPPMLCRTAMAVAAPPSATVGKSEPEVFSLRVRDHVELE